MGNDNIVHQLIQTGFLQLQIQSVTVGIGHNQRTHLPGPQMGQKVFHMGPESDFSRTSCLSSAILIFSSLLQ